MTIKVALRSARPSFLLLTPVCILLGFGSAYQVAPSVNILDFVLVLIGALLAHVSVNTLNEYHDFRSGLDFNTDKTPFSGGSGALPGNPESAQSVLYTGLVSLLITAVIGLYFILASGYQVLMIGLVGMAIIVTYTQWLNRSPLLCLIAPGLGFGVLMVVGTYTVLAGEDARLPWLVSIVPFFLLNNLLLLNQYPDMSADAGVGRRTFPIVFGFKASNLVYALFAMAAYGWIVYLVMAGHIPMLGLIAIIPIVLSLFSLYGAIKYAPSISQYPYYLAANVAAALLTPLLLGLSIIFG